jgi:hypothetical protein
VIDVKKEQYENACDLIRVNSESVSNEIDESDLHCKNYDEQRI